MPAPEFSLEPNEVQLLVQIQKLIIQNKKELIAKIKQRGERLEKLVKFAQFLLSTNIDLTKKEVAEIYTRNKLNILLKEWIRQGEPVGPTSLEEEKETGEPSKEEPEKIEIDEETLRAINEVQQRINEIEKDVHKDKLYVLMSKITFRKLTGVELLIMIKLLKVLKTEDTVKRVIYTKQVTDLLPDKDKIVPKKLLNELDKLYYIAIGLDYAHEIESDYGKKISIVFPLEPGQLLEYLDFLPLNEYNKQRLVKYVPESFIEYQQVVDKLSRLTTEEAITEVLERGITPQSYKLLKMYFSIKAEPVVHEIIKHILGKMNILRKYLEEKLGVHTIGEMI